MNYKSDLTVEEIVAYLKRSDLPAILVEGRDDMSVYRWIEENSNGLLGAVIPCGGRNRVLELARRQREFESKSVAFLIDSDLQCISGDCEVLPNTIWTAGYSIENDLFETGIVCKLMSKNELVKFNRVIGELSKWFSDCVVRIMEGEEVRFCCNSREVVDHDSGVAKNDFDVDDVTRQKYGDVFLKLEERPLQFVRGKNLFDSALYFLSARQRKSKYSRQNLYELCSINYTRSSALVERVQLILEIVLNKECAKSTTNR